MGAFITWRKLNGVSSARSRISGVIWGLEVEVDGSSKSGLGGGEGHGEVFPSGGGVHLSKPWKSQDGGGHFKKLHDQKVGQECQAVVEGHGGCVALYDGPECHVIPVKQLELKGLAKFSVGKVEAVTDENILVALLLMRAGRGLKRALKCT